MARRRAAKPLLHTGFPAVLGPEKLYYIVDHHLGLALLEEGAKEVKVAMLKDLSWLDEAIFWRMMEHNQWVHPFGADGSRYDYEHLPKMVTGLADDPYRSLAGELLGWVALQTTRRRSANFCGPTSCARALRRARSARASRRRSIRPKPSRIHQRHGIGRAGPG